MKYTAIPSVNQLVDHKFECSVPFIPSRMEAGEVGTKPRVVELPHGVIDRLNNEADVNPCNGIGTLDDETAKAILAAFETA